MTRIRNRRRFGIVRWVCTLSILQKCSTANLTAVNPGKSGSVLLSGSSHIVGGNDAPPDRYPYIANLYTRQGELLCGGSLIAPDMVLTASHCAYDFDRIEIGRHDRANDAPDAFEIFGVRHYEVHPSYTTTSYDMDFLVVQLDGSSTFPPIRLNRNSNEPFVGELLTVIGFGDTQVNEERFPTILQQADVFAISNEECESRKDSSYSYEGRIDEDSLCAEAQGRDACGGDSGAPLLIPNADGAEGGDVQVGVVRWGRGCASNVFPGVYGRVSYVSDWIDEIVCSRSADPPDDYGCIANVEADVLTNSSMPQLPVTIVLQLDSYPLETWWVIEDSLHNTIAGSHVGSYDVPGIQVRDVAWLDAGQIYTFILHDVYRDGMCCTHGDGSFAIYLGDASSSAIQLDNRELLVSGSGEFGVASLHVFQMPTRLSEERSLSALPLTIALQLDRYPEETGWSLSRLGDSEQEIVFRGSGVFSDKAKNQQVVETVWVEEGGLYNFTVLDRYADGMCCAYGNGSYRVLLGTWDTSDSTSIVAEGTGAFERSKSEYVLVDAGLSPSSSFLTLEIQFDDFPTEVSWMLEMEVPAIVISAERQAGDDVRLYTIAHGWSYESSLANELVREQHPLPLIPDSPARKFILTFMDSGGNGLCCSNGSGSYKLYYGPPVDNFLLVEGNASGQGRFRSEFLLSGSDPASAAGWRLGKVSGVWTRSAMLSIYLLYNFVL